MPLPRTLSALALALTLSACQPGAVVASPPLPEGAPEGATMPWPAPKDPWERIAAAGLPAYPFGGGEDFHLHAHLAVYQDGRPVVVPASIGIGDKFLAPLHTHAATGVVHVESPEPIHVTVGQFFKLWGVSLAGARVLVDDVLVADGAGVEVKDQQLITVRFGTER